MKDYELLKAMGKIRPEYIEEAAAPKTRKKRSLLLKAGRWAALAAGLALAVLLGMNAPKLFGRISLPETEATPELTLPGNPAVTKTEKERQETGPDKTEAGSAATDTQASADETSDFSFVATEPSDQTQPAGNASTTDDTLTAETGPEGFESFPSESVPEESISESPDQTFPVPTTSDAVMSPSVRGETEPVQTEPIPTQPVPETPSEETQPEETQDNKETTEVPEESPSVAAGGNSEGSLRWYSEYELFTNADLVIKAEVETVGSIVIPLSGPREGQFQYFSILTLSVQQVILGKNQTAGETVHLAIHNINGYDELLKKIHVGSEGIFLMYHSSSETIREYAEYTAGDWVRFAIVETETGLAYRHDAFPGLRNDWNLDNVIAYISELTEEIILPADFSIRFESYSEENNTICCTYDSQSGRYHQEQYYSHPGGDKSLVVDDFTFFLSDDILKEIYRSCRKLIDLPRQYEALTLEQEILVICFTANGEEYYYYYRSREIGYMNCQTEPLASMNPIQYEIKRLLFSNKYFYQAYEEWGNSYP